MYLVAQWAKQEARTWSGTTWNLKNALAKQTQVHDLALQNPGKVQKARYAAKALLTRKGLETSPNFNTDYLQATERQVQGALRQHSVTKDEPVLQVGDLAEIADSLIYQDLSISYLLACRKEDPTAFAASGFQKIPAALLYKRNELQLERYHRAKKILTMSKTLARHLQEDLGFSKEKVIHVGGGTNFSPSHRVREKNRRRLLFIGRDFYRKGGNQVVAAFRLLQQKLPDSELYILGPTKLPKQYQGKNIFFLGDVPREKIENYFALCDIFCMPSRFEAYGLVFIEALSRGLPCIGLNKFEMPYFIEEGVTGYLLTEQASVGDLAERMQTLLENEAIFAHVASRKEQYVAEYAWDAVASRVLEQV
ncbi:glycosyltransferase family 4 protein [Enterococcus asini]|uniref:glycosyltransferase family 4 protein n=1 Tax=Enterococcus asini TaxID=57732 RepID=UPI001E3B305D|nr:glycosyltransferase family 4 protein [Enterococcus asini]MCD5029392.1 glycosyltransferase family 4 protein [Enterococcus asini]MDT2763549.1 glycosyltransferase family 4 protein [Enterococcus asini]MDT2784390.1 glycosyltransferase family 4 protein [Enterococcus asini]